MIARLSRRKSASPWPARFVELLTSELRPAIPPKGIGAICDPAAFSGVVEVPTGTLGPRHGAVAVALVEPDHELPDYTWAYEIICQKVFRDVTPNVVITV